MQLGKAGEAAFPVAISKQTLGRLGNSMNSDVEVSTEAFGKSLVSYKAGCL